MLASVALGVPSAGYVTPSAPRPPSPPTAPVVSPSPPAPRARKAAARAPAAADRGQVARQALLAAAGEKQRGKYRCSRCGELKQNHSCPYDAATRFFREEGAQTAAVQGLDLGAPHAPHLVAPGDKVLVVRRRPSAMDTSP